MFGYHLGESTHWDYIRDNVAPEHWRWLWNEGVREHGLFLHGDPYDGATEALRALDGEGWDLAVLTVRPREAACHTLSWLAHHSIPAVEVHVLPHGARKSSIPCDWYVDDSPANAAELVGAGRLVFLFDRPWNRGCGHGIRVASWSEIGTMLEASFPRHGGS